MRTTRMKLAIAVLAIATIGATAAMADDGQFSDVPETGAGSFTHDPAEWAAANGLTTGCNSPGGGAVGDNFCPNDGVSRGENITFTYRHHTILIEPLLADIESDVTDNATAAAAAQADADAAQADADAAQADADANASAITTNETNIATNATDIGAMPRIYFARVDIDGTVAKTNSASPLTVEKGGDGYYDVTLPEDADNCAVQVTGYADNPALALYGLLQPTFLAYEKSTDAGNQVIQVQVTWNDDENDGVEAEVNDTPFAITAYCTTTWVLWDPGLIIDPIWPFFP